MHEVNEWGYVTTYVNDKELTIKESMCGSAESAFARRLLAYEDVVSAEVDWKGNITAHFRSDETQFINNIEGDFTIEDVSLHSTNYAGLAAHIRFTLNP